MVGNHLFILVLLSVYVLLSGRRTLQHEEAPCANDEDCLQVHLNGSELQRMLRGRCSLGEYSASQSVQRKITFFHLPKTGGSSVRDFLRTHAPHRIKSLAHEHFILSATEQPHNLFATMLREPVSRALSFYTYVQSIAQISKDAQQNPLWSTTHKKPPLEWAESPFIQRTMYQDPLGFFLSNVTNITDSITRFDYHRLQKMPPIPLKTVIPGTLESFLNYTTALPEEYQCRQHLEVAYILLKHYEVVGTLEKVTDFYRVLFKRAKIRDPHAKEVHSNKSKFTLTKEDREAMEALLKRPLYCARVLWKIAGMISDADVACEHRR